jgi:integrase
MAETGKTVIVRERVKVDGKDKEVKKTVKVPLALRSVNLLLFLIKSALDQAQANSIIIRNPAVHCQRYKEAKREMLPLDTDQQKALLESLKDHRLFAAFFLALATGARRGEILALKWSNVDLTEGIVKITESLTRIKGGSKFSEPKTASSKRTIRLPQKALEVLKAHKASQEEEKKKSKKLDAKENITPPTYKDAGLIFCQTNGNKIDPRNFQRTFEIWRDKAGLPKETRLHDLRHTFATMMFAPSPI